MDVPGENDGVIVALSVYHNGIIESVHEPAKWVHSTLQSGRARLSLPHHPHPFIAVLLSSPVSSFVGSIVGGVLLKMIA
jgi:hypothetical protein